MESTVVGFLPMVIGSIVVPLQVILYILLLKSTTQGVLKAVAFLVGMTLARLVQGVLFGFMLVGTDGASAAEAETSSVVTYTLLLVVGIALLVTAYKKWRNEPDPDAPPPKWLTMAESVSVFQAFIMGAALILIAVKLWVFTLSAISTIGEAQLGTSDSVLAFVIYVLLAQSVLILLLLVRIVLPRQSGVLLAALSDWLNKNNRAIVIVVGLVFGAFFVYQGISGLV